MCEPVRRAWAFGLVFFALVAVQDTGAAFDHGVASFDPGQEEIVLWTRYSTLGSNDCTSRCRLHWEVAEDSQFADVVDSGSIHAKPDTDYTVKVLATGLDSFRAYFYRFRRHDDGGMHLLRRSASFSDSSETHC